MCPEQIISGSGIQHPLKVNQDGSVNTNSAIYHHPKSSNAKGTISSPKHWPPTPLQTNRPLSV